MTTTGKQNLTYEPIDNNYYLKPPNDLTANLAGMFLQCFCYQMYIFVSIEHSGWPPTKDIIST